MQILMVRNPGFIYLKKKNSVILKWNLTGTLSLQGLWDSPSSSDGFIYVFFLYKRNWLAIKLKENFKNSDLTDV